MVKGPLAYMGSGPATRKNDGVIELATTAEVVAGLNDTKACTPLGVASLVVAGAPAASTTQAGIIEIATNGEAAAQAASNLALVPANIPSIMAAPGAIGGSTPAAGNFTTLTMTDLVLTNPLGVAEGGTNLASYTTGDTLYASGATTLSKLGIGTARQLLQTNAGATAPQWTSNIDVPGTLDVTGAATLDNSLSVAGAVTTGALSASGLITGTAGATITGAAINLGSDAGAFAVNIGTGAAAKTVTIGNVTGATAVVLNSGTGGVAINTTGAGDLIVNGSDTVLIDSAGILELNSSAGVIGIGNDAVAQAINIGTGAAARTVTVGNGTGASSVVINSGTGAINVGTNAVAHTVTIGNVTGATAVALNAGTGGIALASTGTGDITLASSDTCLIDSAGVLELNSSAGVIGIGNDAVAQAINIGTGAAARTVTVGNTTGASAVVINAGSGATTVNTSLKLNTAATQLQVHGGAVTDFIGTGTLTAGVATILNTNISASDRILIQRIAANGSTAFGHFTYAISAGVNFVVTSKQAASPATTETNDTSTFAYFIIRQI